jgi:hypothetical protein
VKLETLQKSHSDLKEKMQKAESDFETTKKHSASLRTELSAAKENIEKLEKVKREEKSRREMQEERREARREEQKRKPLKISFSHT